MKKNKNTLKALTIAMLLTSSQFVFADDETDSSKIINQAESNGFAEDTSLVLGLRNWYHDRSYNKPSASKDREWTQGIHLKFESGYTQGVVGIGFDAFALEGAKIKDKNHKDLNAVAYKNDGKPKDYWGRAGGAVKARFSSTVLKYGHLMPELPVLNYDDERTIPENFTGFLLTSQEIEGLELNLGKFSQFTSMNSVKHDDLKLSEALVAGGSYQINENLSTALYFSDIEDTFEKKYANVSYEFALSDIDKIAADFNIYRTDYDKKYKKDSDGDRNTIWSTSATYTTGAHSIMLAYQQNSGDTGYDFGPDGGGTIWLANSVFADYNAHKERSYHVKYGIDFEEFGIKGLNAHIGYIYGENINDVSDDKERETYTGIGYTVTNGYLKDLSISISHFEYRTNVTGESHKRDNRIKIEYPLVLL